MAPRLNLLNQPRLGSAGGHGGGGRESGMNEHLPIACAHDRERAETLAALRVQRDDLLAMLKILTPRARKGLPISGALCDLAEEAIAMAEGRTA